MDFQVRFKVNEKIFLRDPESSEVGRQIIKNAIDLIFQLGFEQFTFKKLATEAGSTEATIYRYFENKHKLLLYILNWYWCYMEFLVDYKLQNLQNKNEKLKAVIELLTSELPESSGQYDYNKKYLNQIVISESSKAYLVKDISVINKDEVFKPYKDLCSKIASIILEYQPNYNYPRSLSSTIIESSHSQQFFSENLPKLTDLGERKLKNYTTLFIEDLVFKVLMNA
ncbi:MAG: TetR/AcrR family transcriptional regulator [Bacteroidetes bacterium]|nr:TetR/AcrR family transcriptional regulator [Bacteroidota bacterium]